MCKSSCCPGNRDHGSAALAAIAAVVLAAVIAVPVIHAVEAVVRAMAAIAIVTVGAIGAVAILVATAMLIRRFMLTEPAQAIQSQARRADVPRPTATRRLIAVPERQAGLSAQPAWSVSQIHQQRVLQHLRSCQSCLQATARQIPPGSHHGGGSDA